MESDQENFEFDIGIAGSASLVLQTILLPLSFDSEPSSVMIRCGPHVPWSTCFHYLDLHGIRYVRKIGFDLELDMELGGFYPQGTGIVRARVRPASRLRPASLTVGRTEND